MTSPRPTKVLLAKQAATDVRIPIAESRHPGQTRAALTQSTSVLQRTSPLQPKR